MNRSEIKPEKAKHYIEVESGCGDTMLTPVCTDKNEPLLIKCIKGNEYYATFLEYLQGRRCMKCIHGRHELNRYGMRSNGNVHKYTDEEKIKFVESKGYKFQYFERGAIILICPEGHEERFDFDRFKNEGRRCQKCGKSNGETAIKEYLQRKNIRYIRQYKDVRCYYNNILPFDFAIINNYNLMGLIEFDGKYHYRAQSVNGNIKKLLQIQKRDDVKDCFCEIYEIPLLRIPYWRITDIDDLLEEWLRKVL